MKNTLSGGENKMQGIIQILEAAEGKGIMLLLIVSYICDSKLKKRNMGKWKYVFKP
jgi:hypothetical protein